MCPILHGSGDWGEPGRRSICSFGDLDQYTGRGGGATQSGGVTGRVGIHLTEPTPASMLARTSLLFEGRTCPKALDPERLALKVLSALADADETYDDMSGGWRLHLAPEYFATVEIARAIAKPGKRYVTLEQNVNDAVGWAKGKRFEGNAGSLPAQGRFDIAVWGSGDDGPRATIEVKLGTYFTYGSVSGDVERSCDALARAPRLRWAMSVFHFACWQYEGQSSGKSGKARVRDRTKTIVERAKAYAQDKGVACREFVGDMAKTGDGGSACATVLLFERDD